MSLDLLPLFRIGEAALAQPLAGLAAALVALGDRAAATEPPPEPRAIEAAIVAALAPL